MPPEMSRLKAVELDRAGDLYADFDEKSGLWGVFGSESGFCYETYTSEAEAERVARQMRKERPKLEVTGNEALDAKLCDCAKRKAGSVRLLSQDEAKLIQEMPRGFFGGWFMVGKRQIVLMQRPSGQWVVYPL